MKSLLAIITLVLPTLCAWWPAPHVVAKAVTESLSPKDRIEVFDTIWKTINDEYYDPTFNGVDWAAARDRYRPRVEAAKDDGEFYVLISQMLLDLRDLHTSFVVPDQRPRSSGISVSDVEHKIVVVDVEEDSEAA